MSTLRRRNWNHNFVPRVLSTSRKYPGYGWSRVCYLLADSRYVIEERGWKIKVCLHWAHLQSPVGSGVCKPPVVDRQNSQRRLTLLMLEFSAFHARLKVSSEFGWIFPVERSDGLWILRRWKHLAKKLEMTTTNINGPRGELILFSLGEIHRTYSFV